MIRTFLRHVLQGGTAVCLGAPCQVAFAYGEPDPTFNPAFLPGWEGGGLGVRGRRETNAAGTQVLVLASFGLDGAPTGEWNLGVPTDAIVYAWSIDSASRAEVASYTTDADGRAVPVLNRYIGFPS